MPIQCSDFIFKNDEILLLYVSDACESTVAAASCLASPMKLKIVALHAIRLKYLVSTEYKLLYKLKS